MGTAISGEAQNASLTQRIRDAVGRHTIDRFVGWTVQRTSLFDYHGVTLDLASFDTPAWTLAPFRRDQHELVEVELIEAHLDPELPLLELGGCIGFTACRSNRVLAPGTPHVVVEANPRIVPILRRTGELNGCTFDVVDAAYHPRDGSVDLFVSEGLVLSSLHRETEGTWIDVDAVSLGDLVDEHDLDRFTLVADVEGTEHDLVREELDLLTRRCPRMILEMHRWNGDPAATQARLEDAGYRLVERRDDVYAFERA